MWCSCLTVGDPSSCESSDTKHKLLQSGDATSNTRMRQLSLVKRDYHTQNTDTGMVSRAACTYSENSPEASNAATAVKV
jgi:hypothetical protein